MLEHPGRVHRRCSRRRRWQGLGTTGGFKLQIEDRAGLGYDGSWTTATKALHGQGLRPRPNSPGCSPSYQVNVPQLYADIDRTKARQLGVPVTDVFDTMQIYLGSPLRQRLQQVRPHLLRARRRPTRISAPVPTTWAC